MPERRKLAAVHFASTFWFILCLGYILIITLHQAGIKWWIVFSLSGQGLIITMVLISLYLFAIFRGISSSQKVLDEHPLTSTEYYAFFVNIHIGNNAFYKKALFVTVRLIGRINLKTIE